MNLAVCASRSDESSERKGPTATDEHSLCRLALSFRNSLALAKSLRSPVAKSTSGPIAGRRRIWAGLDSGLGTGHTRPKLHRCGSFSHILAASRVLLAHCER